jgi:hypothetical protein
MIPAASVKKTLHHGTTHGLGTMKRALSDPGSRAIDRRISLGKSLDHWRNELVSGLGGHEQISTQQPAGLAPTTRAAVEDLSLRAYQERRLRPWLWLPGNLHSGLNLATRRRRCGGHGVFPWTHSERVLR